MNEMIREFEALVPAKSLLGRELKALIIERDTQAGLFEAAAAPLTYDTSPYRRANMSIERFLRYWLPRVLETNLRLADEDTQQERLRATSLLEYEYGTRVPVERRIEARMWAQYALNRYRKAHPKLYRVRRYNPSLISELLLAWKTFRHEIRLWKYARSPFDGSQAMTSMMQVIVQLDGVNSFND